VNHFTIVMIAACPFPTWQGSQVLIRQTAEALAGRGHRIHTLTYGYGEYSLTPAFRMHRIPRLPLMKGFRSGPDPSKILLDLFLLIELFRVVHRVKADVIHAHNYEALFLSFPVSKLLGVPLVYHSHTILSREFSTYFRSSPSKKLAGKAAEWADLVTTRLPDRFIAISDDEVEFFSGLGVTREKIDLLPPGITPGEIESGGTGEQEGSICYVGNLDRYQDIDTLFAAVRIAARTAEHVKLTVVTRSDWKRHRETVRRLGIEERVRFLRPGTLDEAMNELRTSSVAVITRNIRSGFPIKLLNYMAAGKAIVATRSAAKILVDGVHALVVEDGNAEETAGAILKLLGDRSLRKTIGRSAHRLAGEQFDLNSRVTELERIYQEITG